MEISILTPTSLEPLPHSIRIGMVILGICGLISLLFTVSFFLFFTYRIIYWRCFSTQSLARNQVFMLIYNLFIADILQATSFVISFWWVSKNKLVGPNMICNAQGLLIQIGDVASGLWALAIAAHSFLNIVAHKTVTHRTFVTLIVLLWSFILILAAIGPLRGTKDFFLPAGAWCWVNNHNHSERLYLHYVWIFASELGSVVLYTFMFFYLRFLIKTNTPRKSPADSTATSPFFSFSIVRNKLLLSAKSTSPRPRLKATKSFLESRTYILKSSRHMVVYTLAYIALTLPLAIGRALSIAGKELPLGYFTAAGILIACSGFVDVGLYVGTRRVLVTSSVTRDCIDVRDRSSTKPLVSGENEFAKKIAFSKLTNHKNTPARIENQTSITTPRSYCDDSEIEKVEWPI